jgi:hypothetical protein
VTSRSLDVPLRPRGWCRTFPTPFVDLLRGRRAIREHRAAEIARHEDVRFRAQVLPVGDTYGVAHWRASYRRAAVSPVSLLERKTSGGPARFDGSAVASDQRGESGRWPPGRM